MVNARSTPGQVSDNSPLWIRPAGVNVARAGKRDVVLRRVRGTCSLVSDVGYLGRHSLGELVLKVEIPGLCVSAAVIGAAGGGRDERIQGRQRLTPEKIRQGPGGSRRSRGGDVVIDHLIQLEGR